jgi:hypothetical protein
MSKTVIVDDEEIDVLHLDGLQIHRCDEVLPNGQVHHYSPTHIEVEGHSFEDSFYDAVSKELAEAVYEETRVDLEGHDIRVVDLDSDEVEVL